VASSPNLEHRGVDGFLADVTWIRDQFRQGVPSYFKLLGYVQAMLAAPQSSLLVALERAWRHRTFYVAYDRPLLLLAALRADALIEGPSHPLHRAIGADPPLSEELSPEDVELALAPERTQLFATLATRWVQTNETLRSIAWRWPAFLAGCEGGAKPLALVDLGASAGLNLVAERLPAVWTDPSGAPIPAVSAVRAVVRLGLDARPVDLTDRENVNWMRACLWPGDRGRLERLEAALRIFRNAQRERPAPVLEQADVGGFASRLARLAMEHEDAFLLAYQTVFREYLAPAVRDVHLASMHAWLGSIAPGRALWMELETAATDAKGASPVAITAHVRAADGDVRVLEIARTSHHPREVKTIPERVHDLLRALGSWNTRGQGC
jgi:hypothetical protein